MDQNITAREKSDVDWTYNDTSNLRPAYFGIQSYVQSNFTALIFCLRPILRENPGDMGDSTSNFTSRPTHVQRCTSNLRPVLVQPTSNPTTYPRIRPTTYNFPLFYSRPTLHPNCQIQCTSNYLYVQITSNLLYSGQKSRK